MPRLVLVVALAAFALFRPGPAAEARPAAPAAPALLQLDLVTGFINEINLLRSTLGLRTLTVSSQLSNVATRWAQQMAAEDRLYHNPNLTSQVSGWIRIGENVGVGYDVLGLMNAFIGSPSHYANLVDPNYTHLGVGVASGPNGTIYTTHDFITPEEAQPAPDPAPEPDPTPAPDPDPAPSPRRSTPRPAPAPTTTATPHPAPVPVTPVVPVPHPTEQRVAAVLEPLRTLERGA